MTSNKELMVAIATKDLPKVKTLMESGKISINECDINGNSPLNYACAMGIDEDIILKMLERGADVTLKNKAGAAPLTHAVYSKMSPKILEGLVKAGGEIDYKNESGGTALQISCVCKAGVMVITKLLELGADADLANAHGNTPLIFAVRNHNDLDVITLLASKTKTVNHKTDDPKYSGFTALHFAAGEHLPAVAAILINHGADTSQKNDDGYTPLQLADENTRTAMLSSSFAKFSMNNEPPIEGGIVGSRVSVKKIPLRRTSLLAQNVSTPPPREGTSSGTGRIEESNEEGAES